MRAIHLKDVHIPRSQNLFAFFVGEALWATIALFFLLTSLNERLEFKLICIKILKDQLVLCGNTRAIK